MLKLYYILSLLSVLSLQLHYTECILFRNQKFGAFPYLFGGLRTLYNLNEIRPGITIRTNLAGLRGIYAGMRHLILHQEFSHFDEVFQRQVAMGKIQLPQNSNFPCNLTNMRSEIPPTSVHRVRPGDIDIIASMGDSLSAGNGEISENMLQILSEFRGIAFAGGGIGTWRKFLTLPNILKLYNPKIYGYSTGDVLALDEGSQLNIAEPMMMSRDLSVQARDIIRRMRRDPNIDIQHHWKLLTIFVGNNDICSDMCHYNTRYEWTQLHYEDLRKALTILRDNVPRLIVNLLTAPNVVTALVPMKQIPWHCSLVHRLGCHCVFTFDMSGKHLRFISETIKMWQKVEEDIANLLEFQTDDFTVIYQPFTSNVAVPTLPNGGADLRYFANDCFHFSQLGHASAANSLWNNMFEPIGAKTTYLTPVFEEIKCPTEEHPYIVTWKNQFEE